MGSACLVDFGTGGLCFIDPSELADGALKGTPPQLPGFSHHSCSFINTINVPVKNCTGIEVYIGKSLLVIYIKHFM